MKFTSDSHTKRGRLNKLESFVVLKEDRHSFTSSAGFAAVPRNTIVGGPRQATFTIDVSLRRGRIALLTVVMVGAIVALMRFFQNGYEIRRYSAKPEPALQKELLDTYNSYSGNIVSVFGKPIETAIHAMGREKLEGHVHALVLSGGVGYLISNGFNSLNVQLVDLELQLVVNTSDLYLDEAVISSVAGWESRITNVTHSVSENQPANPIANTVLRNLVESRAVRAKTVCEQNVTVTMRKPFLMDTVEYGFPQRDWMKKLLPEALSPTTMAITMNRTKRADVVKLKGEDLPMNASIAADLAIYAVICHKTWCRWSAPWQIRGTTHGTEAASTMRPLLYVLAFYHQISRRVTLSRSRGSWTAWSRTSPWRSMDRRG